jgi:PAS domain S-box-containing protein
MANERPQGFGLRGPVRTDAYGELFQSFARSTDDCVAVLDLEGRIEQVNPAGCKALGLAAAEAVNWSWRNTWPEEHWAVVDRAMRTARSGQASRFRAYRSRESATPSWWDTTVSVVVDEDGAPQRLLTVSRDVTQEIEAGSVLDTIIEHVPAALFAKDARDGRYVLLNIAAQELFGRSREEMIGHSDAELFSGEIVEHIRAAEADVVKSGRMNVEEVARGVEGGELRYYRTRTMATFGDEGARHIIGVAQDVTEERKAAELLKSSAEQADAANHAKSAFLANMSHEIRTPLNGVVGVADVLSGTALTAEQKDMVELIRSSGATLERLLSDVLDLARVESGRIDIETEPFHLADAMRAVAALLRMRAEEKGVALKLETPPEAERHVLGDLVRIKQILTNLVSNAIKFTEAGEVRLVATSLGGSGQLFRFEVRDTGVGFDPSQKDRVFSRFQQADGSITRRFGGTGLGLAISLQLAELMGGSLDCDSTPGKGSVFSLTLPLKPADAPAADQTTTSMAGQAASLAAAGAAMRVLLADDHPTNRKVVELILSQANVDLVCVEDGQAAVDAFRADRFDAILMDMQMPVMDGLTATCEIRRLEARQGRTPVPIIMLTANALHEHIDAGRQAGADRHLTKPIAAEKLLQALSDVARSATSDPATSSRAG